MRRFLPGLVMLATLCLSWTDAQACGDKFLVLGRGVRNQRAAGASHPARILVYLDPNGHLAEAMQEMNLGTHMKLAGHKVRSVETRADLATALASGHYDIVLADISNMRALESDVRSAPAKPALLPVIYNPTGEELAMAERQYSCVMKSPSKKQHFLAVIDDAMVLRLKEGRTVR
jgi:hypothetical protein